MSWPVESLGDLCHIEIGRTPARNQARYWGAGSPWLSIADMNGKKHVSTTKEQITTEAVRECRCRQVQPGTVLMSFKLSLGKVAMAACPIYTNEAIAALPIKNAAKLCPEYLYWALQQIDFTLGQDRAAKGLTLNKPKLAALKIPVPPLEEQRRIAAMLDKAEELCAKRHAAIALLDQLPQAIFLEMFGDPATNPRGWPLERLGAVARTTSGGTPNRKIDAYYGGTIPWVKSGELHQGTVTRTEEHITEEALRNSSAKLMPPGTILVAMYGATVGAIAELGIEASTNQAVCCIQPGKRLSGTYLKAFLHCQTVRLLSQRVGGAQPNLSQDLIRSLEVLLPPLELQNGFAERIEAIHRAKSAHQSALAELDALFASLQWRVFSGDCG